MRSASDGARANDKALEVTVPSHVVFIANSYFSNCQLKIVPSFICSGVIIKSLNRNIL